MRRVVRDALKAHRLAGLRDELILVDQSPEQVTAADLIEVDDAAAWLLFARWYLAGGSTLLECTVWPVLVVMSDVGREAASIS